MKRYLIVNIDKHQGDVTATDRVPEDVWDDVLYSLSMVIDLQANDGF